MCTTKTFVFQLSKSFFPWFWRVSQELMRSRFAATWMSPPFLHRTHGDHTSPTSLLAPPPSTTKSHRHQNSTTATTPRSPLPSLHVLLAEKNRSLQHPNTFLPFIIGLSSLLWVRNIALGKTDHKCFISPCKEINTKKEVKNNYLVMYTCITH